MKYILMIGLAAVAIFVLGLQIAQSDYERDDEEGWSSGDRWRTADVAAVENPRYIEECASCHMAYPPGLLPAPSWERMMSTLDDHFGDNAELDPAVAAEITGYLIANSADATSDYRRSRRIGRTLSAAEAPLRITELAYIRHEHDEIPTRLINGNPEVNSLANCVACHHRAERGSFSEREIRIPGVGRWDD